MVVHHVSLTGRIFLVPFFCLFENRTKASVKSQTARCRCRTKMEAAQNLESQAFLLRKRLDKLRHDVDKHRTPLELRIARTLFDERNNLANQQRQVVIPKPRITKVGGLRQRPAWGAGPTTRLSAGANSPTKTNVGNKTGGYSSKQIFATPSQVDIEYDDAVLIGRKDFNVVESSNGPKWHCVVGAQAQDILIKQSNKRLGKAYEYLKKETPNTEYPGLIPSETESVYSANDEERNNERRGRGRGRAAVDGGEEEKEEEEKDESKDNTTVRRSRGASGSHIPMRANATSAEILKGEAHRWLHRGRELLKFRLEEVSQRMKEHEERMNSKDTN